MKNYKFIRRIINPQIYFGVSCLVIGKDFQEKIEHSECFIDGEIWIDGVIEIINDELFSSADRTQRPLDYVLDSWPPLGRPSCRRVAQGE